MNTSCRGDVSGKHWPSEFATPQEPKSEWPFINSLRDLSRVSESTDIVDVVRLFMQNYDDGRISLDIEIVSRFCRNIHKSNLENQESSNAWLDDRSTAYIESLDKGERKKRSSPRGTVNPSEQSTEQPGSEINLLSSSLVVESTNLTDDSHASQFVTHARKSVRKYPERMSAQKLYDNLLQKRFNHEFLEDANRRLIHIMDPDPQDLVALLETASAMQASAVRDLLSQYLAIEKSFKVEISSQGFATFRLELNLPYFAMRKTTTEALRKMAKKPGARGWIDLAFLVDGSEECNLVAHQAQQSFVICGADNSQYVAYCLEDAGFDEDRQPGIDESIPGLVDATSVFRADQISMEKLDANLPFQDPREYFLAIASIRAMHMLRETRDLVEAIETSWRRHYLKYSIQRMAPSYWKDNSTTLDWNGEMLELLSTLIEDVSEKVDIWSNFTANGDTEWFNDCDSTLSSDSQNHIQKRLRSLQSIFQGMELLLKKLQSIERRCEKISRRLDSRLAQQGSRNSEFTINVISPIIIVAGIFAIPAEVVSYRKTSATFIFSVWLGILFMYLLQLSRSAWTNRQRWCGAILRRARSIRYRDDSITTTNHFGARVLRRRPTHRLDNNANSKN